MIIGLKRMMTPNTKPKILLNQTEEFVNSRMLKLMPMLKAMFM